MRIRSPSLPDRDRLIEIISEGETFQPDEVSCAIELLDAALARAEGNTYEPLVAIEDGDLPVGYVCFGQVAATEMQLRARGARTIRIETSSLKGQGGAARFYERAGYRRVGVIPDFYRADDLITFAKVP